MSIQNRIEGIILARPYEGVLAGTAFVGDTLVDRIPNGIGEWRRQVYITMARISRDGLVTIHKSISPAGPADTLPDKDLLKSMAKVFASDGSLPREFDGEPLKWSEVDNTREVDNLLSRHQLEATRAQPMNLGYHLERDLQALFVRLLKNDSSLAGKLALHHAEVAPLLARLSTDMSNLVEVFRERPWLQVSWLNSWAREKSVTDFATPYGIAASIGDGISPEVITWCDRFMAGREVTSPHSTLLRFISAMPRSWWPSTEDDYQCLHETAGNILGLAKNDLTKAIDLIRPAKGRFTDYFRSLVSTSIPDGSSLNLVLISVNNAISNVYDFLDAIDVELVMPFLPADDGYDDNLVTASRLVSEGGSLRRYLEASLAWHDRPPKTGRLTTPEHKWPACVGNIKFGNMEVIELCSAQELWEEGIAMKHCVGGDNYVRSCMDGRSRILSIRENGVRLSTAEFPPADFVFQQPPQEGYDTSSSPHPEITAYSPPSFIQHQGYGNRPPPDKATWILMAWSEAVKAGEVVVRPVEPVPMPAIEAVELPGYGPEAWRGLIRRDLAQMSWEEFGTEVRRLQGVPEPSEEAEPLTGIAGP